MTSPAPSDDLARRYGTPSPVRRGVLLAVVGVVAAVFLAWLGWTALDHADPEVSSDLVTFTVEGEHVAVVQVRVELREDDVTASCLLRATAGDHTVVGELAFQVTADDLAQGAVLEREVRTERRATSVELVGCVTPDQPRPR